MDSIQDQELRRRIRKQESLTVIGRLLGFRRVSFCLAKYLMHTRITPNTITYVGIIFIVMGSVLIAAARSSWMLLGAALLLASGYLDYTDGDLARATGKQSSYGGWLDKVSFFAFQIALLLGVISGSYVKSRSWLVLALGTLAVFNYFIYFTGRVALSQLHSTEGPPNVPIARKHGKPRLRQRLATAIQRRLGFRVSVSRLEYFVFHTDTRFAAIILGALFDLLLIVLIYLTIWSVYAVISMYFDARWHLTHASIASSQADDASLNPINSIAKHTSGLIESQPQKEV